VPCGIADREVTSLELEVADPTSLPSLEQVADAAARYFGHVFNEEVLAVESVEALRSGEALRSDVQQIGAPMRVPAEVERLLNPSAPTHEKPVSA
jgi:hypothetical protein